jgi:hypothetical protein
MGKFLKEGYDVEFVPFRNKVGSREYREMLDGKLDKVKVKLSYEALQDPCDILIVYADDFVWDFTLEEVKDAFSKIVADRKVMVINYRRGRAGEIKWTRHWDKYMFLNSDQEKEFLREHPGVKTKVLAPCTELEEFLNVQPNYNTNLRIVRHNSQGDTKFPKDIGMYIEDILKYDEHAEISMMPGPSFITDNGRFRKLPRNTPPIPEFLGTGNLFWYSLPVGYMDMGPRVILEAMAAGLPVIADNWGGAPDRVTPETGWICDAKGEHVEIIKHLSSEDLKRKGQNAKQRAREEFVPDKWIKEIIE